MQVASERMLLQKLGRNLLALGAIAVLIGGAANAQNFDQGKSVARLFADNCATCHRSARGPRGSRLATIWHRSHFWVPVFGLTGKSNRNLINVLEVLLLGGPRERVLELRILAAAGGRHLSLPGLRHRVGADPAGCRRRKVARLCRAA